MSINPVNPLLVPLDHQVNTIMQSSLSSENKRGCIRAIISRILEQQVIMELDYLERIDGLQGYITSLEKDFTELKLKESLSEEKINHLIAKIHALLQNQQISKLTAAALEENLQVIKEEKRVVLENLGHAEQENMRAQQQINTLEANQTNLCHQLRTSEAVNTGLIAEGILLRRNLAESTSRTHYLEKREVERLAEAREVERLHKIFVEATFTRQIVPLVPYWRDRLDGIKQASFFTYLNPICATTWLNVSDKFSLAGRGRRVKQELEKEKKNNPHWTEIEAMHQVLRSDNLQDFIRSKDVYIGEYVAQLPLPEQEKYYSQ